MTVSEIGISETVATSVYSEMQHYRDVNKNERNWVIASNTSEKQESFSQRTFHPDCIHDLMKIRKTTFL